MQELEPHRRAADSIVRQYDSLGGFNGIIILASDTNSVEVYEYGYKDPVAKADRISVADRFDLASLTKQFTGLAILQLIQSGKLKPYERIGSFFPELKPALQRTTLQKLANHTCGIHDYHALTTKHDSLNVPWILSMLSELDTLDFPEHSRWGYTNSAYVLLSVLANITTSTSV